jgi:hypothetical protein
VSVIRGWTVLTKAEDWAARIVQKEELSQTGQNGLRLTRKRGSYDCNGRVKRNGKFRPITCFQDRGGGGGGGEVEVKLSFAEIWRWTGQVVKTIPYHLSFVQQVGMDGYGEEKIAYCHRGSNPELSSPYQGVTSTVLSRPFVPDEQIPLPCIYQWICILNENKTLTINY